MMQSNLPVAEIQVGGQGSAGNKVAFVLGLIGSVAGVALYFVDPIFTAMLLPISMVCLVASLAVAFVRYRRRAWIRDTGEGFTYRTAQKVETYADDEAIGVRVVARNNYRQGLLKSFTRSVELKVAGREKPLKLKQTVHLNSADPLVPFLNRTIRSYHQRATDALEAGAKLNGKGWSLGRDALEVTSPEFVQIPIQELIAMDSIDRQHNVWRKGGERPCLTISEASENAFLLELLLRPRIEAHQKDQPFGISEPGLGRQLFQRSTGAIGRWFAWICIWGGLASIIGGISLFLTGKPDPVAIGLVLCILGGIAMPIGLVLRHSDFRCYERGVYRKTMFAERVLRFEEVEAFSYSATRQYYNGAYVGTALKLRFEPRKGSGKPLKYSRSVQNADEALDSLRDHVSRVLMIRMAEAFHSQGSAQWMPYVRISREGFHYRPQGIIGRKKETCLSFPEVLGFEIQNGTFHIWKNGVKKSVIHESVSQPNFFPGYFFVVSLFDQRD
jgi:hypothetical protein